MPETLTTKTVATEPNPPQKKDKNNNKTKKNYDQFPSRSPASYEIILDSMKVQSAKVWGFVFVRCTYNSDERWKAFLAKIEESANADGRMRDYGTNTNSPEEVEFLKQSFRMTTIEDKEKLDKATMLDASIMFQEWTKGEGNVIKKHAAYRVPRWNYYVYVNEESIESVLNPIRAKEFTGNFLVLVNAALSIDGESDEDDPDAAYTPQDDGDESFKLVSINGMVLDYVFYAEDMNSWYPPGNTWDGPPYVEGSRMWRDWWGRVLKEDEEGALGLDVYLMLKQIYGKGHYRSPCFVDDVAQTKTQRLRGYNGGFNFRPR